MPLVIYNTLTRKKETFTPLDPAGKKVTIYNCGPTVYGRFHIGNARNFVVMDVVRRYLEWLGYDVVFVQNLTDIEDKIIAQAREENISTDEVAKKYTDAYFEDADKLGIRRATDHPKATDYVDEMIELMKGLEAKGLAYESGGSLYFRVRQFADYGKLSGRSVDDMRTGARVEANEEKDDPLDFVLWKASKPGEPTWDSPWGKGRPGWHTECAVMSQRLLGDTIDIHSGGTDLMFPHHENELAQREGLTGKPFARYWMHNGFLNIDSEKMSKSVGNIMKVDDVLKNYSRAAVRYFLLSAHYRHPLDYSQDALEEATSSVGRINLALKRVEMMFENGESEKFGPRSVDRDDAEIASFMARFEDSMNDDFNTPQALAVLHAIINALVHESGAADLRLQNLYLAAKELRDFFELRPETIHEELTQVIRFEVTGTDVMTEGAVLTLLYRLFHNYGDAKDSNLREKVRSCVLAGGFAALANGNENLTWDKFGGRDARPSIIDLFRDLRNEARERRAFDLADMIRDGLAAEGIVFEDGPQGTRWLETEPSKTKK